MQWNILTQGCETLTEAYPVSESSMYWNLDTNSVADIS